MDTLRWLGVVGLFAAMVNILRQFVDSGSRLSWWQKLLNGVLVGALSVGISSLMIATWPDIHFLMLFGLASMAGYLGTDFVMWLAYRVIGDRRWHDGKADKV